MTATLGAIALVLFSPILLLCALYYAAILGFLASLYLVEGIFDDDDV